MFFKDTPLTRKAERYRAIFAKLSMRYEFKLPRNIHDDLLTTYALSQLLSAGKSKTKKSKMERIANYLIKENPNVFSAYDRLYAEKVLQEAGIRTNANIERVLNAVNHYDPFLVPRDSSGAHGLINTTDGFDGGVLYSHSMEDLYKDAIELNSVRFLNGEVGVFFVDAQISHDVKNELINHGISSSDIHSRFNMNLPLGSRADIWTEVYVAGIKELVDRYEDAECSKEMDKFVRQTGAAFTASFKHECFDFVDNPTTESLQDLIALDDEFSEALGLGFSSHKNAKEIVSFLRIFQKISKDLKGIFTRDAPHSGLWKAGNVYLLDISSTVARGAIMYAIKMKHYQNGGLEHREKYNLNVFFNLSDSPEYYTRYPSQLCNMSELYYHAFYNDAAEELLKDVKGEIGQRFIKQNLGGNVLTKQIKESYRNGEFDTYFSLYVA
ncbi:TPA: hypothetical protein I7730_01505 [Vibrio vulnificus]|uniref:Uncharacterized protein n=1 Tax=Vibrio vulnificus TaxID=672 RepID=A0A8H9K6Q3_VIBVL|nr:hypothetical protein [Vibrio vulnificus]HAS8538473.1 hypothetical protein [Vibrio vulnificus]